MKYPSKMRKVKQFRKKIIDTKANSCVGKKKYSKGSAIHGARKLVDNGENVHAYKCYHCPYYHVGHFLIGSAYSKKLSLS